MLAKNIKRCLLVYFLGVVPVGPTPPLLLVLLLLLLVAPAVGVAAPAAADASLPSPPELIRLDHGFYRDSLGDA